MDNNSVGQLWRDEQGGGTIFSLFWFILLVGICGLAVDITDGFRSRTMLQATADSSAMAGAIDLPNNADVIMTAVDYAELNMATGSYGSVLMPEDVTIGAWEHETRTFTPESDVAPGTPLDAVHVMVNQGAVNGNALATNFLRIIGLTSWNVKAQAIAQRFIPGCLRDGLVARGMVDMSSNNGFVNEICVHGQQGVDIQSNNYFELGVNVSAPDLTLIEAQSGNTGLPEAKREDILDPRMVDHIDEIIQGLLDKDPAVVPSYIDLTQDVILTDESFDPATAIPGRIYYAECKPNKNLNLPADALLNQIVLVADCRIHIGANSVVISSVIASRSGPPNDFGQKNKGDANITTAAGVQLGLPDNCATGGGVQMFSNATMFFSSSTSFDGVQIVAAYDVSLGAMAQGINGISVQAGGNIYMTSNNMFGLCSGGVPGLFTVNYYRLVL